MADAVRRTLHVRLRAAGIHFGISAVIFVAVVAVMVAWWYPGFHFAIDGGWQGVRILVAVDLVLGPTLTLIIFNPLKARRLIIFDLSCIGATQLAALIWGVWAIHSQHPVAVTYYDGEFHSITIAPLKIEKYDPAQLAQLSERYPPLVYVAEPANEDEEVRAAMQEVMGEVALHEDPFFFRPFAANWATLRLKAVEAAARSKSDPAFAADLPRFLEARSAQAQDFLYFPYTGRYGSCTLAFTLAGELVDALGCRKD